MRGITEKEVEKQSNRIRKNEEKQESVLIICANTHAQISTLFIAPGVTMNKHKVNITRTAQSFS